MLHKKTFKQVLLTVDSFKTIYFYTETILRPATTRTRSEWAPGLKRLCKNEVSFILAYIF